MAQAIETGAMPYEAQQMDVWLRDGNPTLGWRGDPRLYLSMGYMTATRNGVDPKTKRYAHIGDILAMRWEVWRHNEDGTDLRLFSRQAEALTDIIPTLIGIDPRTPGHEPTMDKVEREDAIVQKERATAIGEAHGEAAEHLWKLVADKTNGPSTFRGMPGRNPDKQL
jgi:hypothetical protein